MGLILVTSAANSVALCCALSNSLYCDEKFVFNSLISGLKLMRAYLECITLCMQFVDIRTNDLQFCVRCSHSFLCIFHF